MLKRIPSVEGVALATLRFNRGWLQQDLSRVAGLPHGYVSDYETGRRPLTEAALRELARLLGYQPGHVDLVLGCVRRLRFEPVPAESPGELSPRDQVGLDAELAGLFRSLEALFLEPCAELLVRHRLIQARAAVEEPLGWLLRLPPEHRQDVVELVDWFQDWALCERLCAESERAAAADARQALDLADLALKIATLCRGGEAWLSRLQGYAWAFVGNARRVANDLVGADEAFARSTELWPAGQPDPHRLLDESRIHDLQASLRKDQRRWPEALDLLDQAWSSARSEDVRARLLLKKSAISTLMSDFQGAIEAIHRIKDVEVEPRIRFGARFNLAVNYCQLGKHESAASLLPQIRRMAQQLGNSLDLIRTAWLEGKVAAGLGRRLEAIPALERVREEFAGRGLGCDMALVTLELAVLYLEEGHAIKVRELARQMFTILKSQGIHREMLAAVKLFYDAAERRDATVELARDSSTTSGGRSSSRS